MNRTYTIGLDYGTQSARALLVRTDGLIAATAVCDYVDGVIDEHLPGSRRALGADWALQNPADWLTVLEAIVPQVLAAAGVAGEQVIGIGVDFTACTILPTTADGTPLCQLPAWRETPHAWPKLWKHHAAQPQADRFNQVAVARGEAFLARYGGRVSSEWLLPKALSILEEAPSVYDAASRIIEGGDWLVWQLSGQERRNACAAGYKACWTKGEGYPSADFLAALHPRFAVVVEEKLSAEVLPAGAYAGGLTPAWAGRLGLPAGVAVGVAMIDAHAGALGMGVGTPGVLGMIMGTSTCHMLLGREAALAEGISGVVEDGIVPGLFGYEAGQAGVGDIFAWFVEHGAPAAYEDEARASGVSLHELLSARAARLAPGASGLLALDWWNGCRTPLVDADLTGVIFGYSLNTKPEEVYRALIEATAFGTRLVIETFTSQGVPVERLVATGGLTKNRLLMQIYADVTNRPIEVAGTEQATGLGAAMLGATAAGSAAGGFDSLGDAVAAMASVPAASYQPDAGAAAVYEVLYRQYSRLVDQFGRRADSPLKALRQLKLRSM
ncbi:MAG: ribulokinase [Anaerolineae bacterium]